MRTKKITLRTPSTKARWHRTGVQPSKRTESLIALSEGETVYTVRKEGRFTYTVTRDTWVVTVTFTLRGAKRSILKDKRRRAKDAQKTKTLGPTVYQEEK